MSRKKTRTYKAGSFESTGNSKDTTASIYNSMLTHPAFTSLKTRQKILYVYIKLQLYGKRKPKHDFPEVEEVASDLCFYLNHAAVVDYGLYVESNHKDFYKDMQELEEHGFIEKISSGKTHRKKNIYKFSSKWQEWDTG